MQPTIRPLAALIGRLLDKPSNDPECIVRAFTVFGQILIFRTVRSATLKSLGWAALTQERVELIRTIIQQHVTSSVKGLSAVQPVGVLATEKPSLDDRMATRKRKSYRRNRN